MNLVAAKGNSKLKKQTNKLRTSIYNPIVYHQGYINLIGKNNKILFY